MHKRLNALTIIGMIMVFTGLGHLLTAFLASPENRWTPRTLALGLEESADRIRVLVADKPLTGHIQNGTLKVTGEGGAPRPVKAEEIRFRFNNWDRVRAENYYRAIFTASYTTAGAAALLVGLLLAPRLPGRPDTS